MNPKAEAKGLGQPFYILNRSGQEALLAHVLDAEHASKTQAMVFFSLRKRSFNCLLTPCIDSRASRRLRKVHDAIQSILPNMSVHHPSLHGFSKAFFSSAACRTGFAVTEVLPVSITRCGFPVQHLFLRADIQVVFPIEFETIFPVMLSLMCLPPVSK